MRRDVRSDLEHDLRMPGKRDIIRCAAPPPPIAPPPPVAPDPEPTKLGLGQTPDQVIAALGQPKSIAKITEKKQIYIYKDLKVTFVNGKVSDVQ